MKVKDLYYTTTDVDFVVSNLMDDIFRDFVERALSGSPGDKIDSQF